MSRYRNYPPGDEEPLSDFDGGFMGFRSRVQPAALPPGVASYLGNMRCERGTARVRKGPKALATDLVLSNPPVVLDFDLPTEIVVTSITRSGGTATVTTATPHGFTTGDVAGVEGADQADYNGDFEITVTDTDEFTYAVANSPATPATGTIVTAVGPRIFDTYTDFVWGACVYASSANVEGIVLATTSAAYVYREGVALVEIGYPAGETVTSTDQCHLEQYLNQVYLFRGYQTAAAQAVTSITQTAGTATLTTTAAHGRATGDWVTVEGATQVGYNGVHQITVTGTDTFTFAVDSSVVSPATGTITARPCKIPLVWDQNVANDFVAVTSGAYATTGTLIRMPAVDWAVQFMRRLVLPYARDQIILGDFGSAASFDLAYNQLRIMPGTADWLVGVLPYQLRGLVVLYRKSVHLVSISTTDAAPTGVQEVTRDFGCAARRSAANCGDTLLWLSDQGVHGLSIASELNIVPLKVPLSDQIQDLIDRINWEYAGAAVAKYWNNRYYLAVPLDDATTNSTVLVFNFLNRSETAALGEWESVDTYPGDFDVRDFVVMDYQGQKRLHAITTYGWIFVEEELEVDEWGVPGESPQSYAISGELTTRDYRCGTLERKKFTRVQLETSMTTGDAFTADFVTRNPDSTAEIMSYTATATGDVSHRARSARQRGVGGVIEIETTAGRPEFRTVGIEAILTDRRNFTRT